MALANERWSFRGLTIKQTGKILVFGSVVAYKGSTPVERKGLNLYEKNVGQFIDHTDIFFDPNTSQCKITIKLQYFNSVRKT